MSTPPTTGYEALDRAAAQRIDAACDRFERAWRAGESPPFDNLLDGLIDPERAVLVRELILVDAPYRRRAGQPPRADDYRTRFPELDAYWLDAALGRPDEAPTRPQAASGPSSFPIIAGYELLAEAGRGGMGVVYKARQLRLNRLVAVKTIRTGPSATTSELTLFQAEAEAVARLHHPNIVQVYEAGVANGHPYLAMEYVPDGTLAGASNMSSRTAAELMLGIAKGIQHAHERGVVHRDLKPANILLLDSQGKSPTSGASDTAVVSPDSRHLIPKVADFGLVKRLDSETLRSQTGAIVGTPAYMAPEQTLGRSMDVGPAADVYGLGAILYELLAGRPPFQGATALETLDLARDQEPAAPRTIRSSVPRDLETICLKCLRKEPARRYPSAGELANDLRRFLDGEPVHARSIGFGERAIWWARKRPAGAALVLVGLLGIVVGLPTVTWLWRRAESALERESAAHGRETSALRDAEAELNGKRIAIARRAWTDGDLSEARRQLDETAEPFRTTEWHELWRACHSELHVYRGHRSTVSRVAFTADGRYAVSADMLGSIHVWEVVSGTKLWSINEPWHMSASVAFGPGPGEITSVTEIAGPPTKIHVQIRVYDVRTGKELRTYSRTGELKVAALSPDGRHLALIANTVAVMSLADGKDIYSGPLPPGLPGAAWSSDSTKVAIVGDQKRILRINVTETPARTEYLPRSTGERIPPLNFALDTMGRRIAFARGGQGDRSASVHVWDLEADRQLVEFSAHVDSVRAIAFSRDGTLLATTGQDRAVRVCDAATGKELLVLRGHAQMPLNLVFSPDGSRLATGSIDGTARVWDLAAIR